MRSIAHPYRSQLFFHRVDCCYSRSLSQSSYPVLSADALYEKIRMDNRIVSVVVWVVCCI
ncbi:transposase [Agathobaculum sp. Marseille-P7918]|uniref:transposase n=1 Tax=Agathobaculum sp. Marseille-P7918 TaxID=2479843 RepID=UPI003569D83B